MPAFGYAESVKIHSSWRDLVDTCKIMLPRRISNGYWNQNGVSLNKVIQRGMPVTVQLGYGGNSLPAGGSGFTDKYTTVFTGFVSSVGPSIPVEIDCEDNMFKFKNITVAPKIFQNPTLSQILDYCKVSAIIPYKTQGVITIPDFTIDRGTGTVLRVLNKLREHVHIYSFLRIINGVETVVVGQPYDASRNVTEHILRFGENVVDYGKLKYMDANDIKIELQAIGKNLAGKELSVSVGDAGGDHFTWYCYQTTLDAKALKDMANRRIAYYKYTGYRGDIECYGLPTLKHGEIASLQDPDWNDRDGKYFIDAVLTEWGKNGFHQRAPLGPLASAVYNIDALTA